MPTITQSNHLEKNIENRMASFRKIMNLPNDADADVIRRLASDGFDFTVDHNVDFNVDFDSWPPVQEAVESLERSFGEVEIIEDDELDYSYLLVVKRSRLSYEFVMRVQSEITELVSKYGGQCVSWGVMN